MSVVELKYFILFFECDLLYNNRDYISVYFRLSYKKLRVDIQKIICDYSSKHLHNLYL